MSKGFMIVIVIIIVVFGGVVLLKKGDSKSGSPDLTFATIQQDIAKGAKLYDVRTSEEYKSGHFAGAVNWSLQDIEAGKLPDVAINTKIYVYCQSGSRAAKALALLKNTGYTSVTNLQGLANVESMGGKLVTD